jgi:hypothetical protein
MSNINDYPSCSDRENNENNKNIDKNPDKFSRFKENILNSGKISSKVLENIVPFGEKTEKARFFRLSISAYDEKDKTCIDYSKEIYIFDFEELLECFFGIGIDENFDEDDKNQEDGFMIFKNLDEVIDYLQNNRKDQE